MTPFQYRIKFLRDNRVEIILKLAKEKRGNKMRNYFNEKSMSSYSRVQNILNILESVYTFLSIDRNP